MFGWEFPPHISGGLGTACYGLTQSLLKHNIHIHFVVPKAYGDEDKSIHVLDASQVVVPHHQTTLSTQQPTLITTREHTGLQTIPVHASIMPYTTPVSNSPHKQSLSNWNFSFIQEVVKEIHTGYGKRFSFTGTYGPTLLEEVVRYAEVAKEIARAYSFDIIHAHDWLTYRAGIEARRISGKPLVIHVHATEYDRAGEQVDERVFTIEREGMRQADKIIAVSTWTKKIITERYGIPSQKVVVVHNGVTPTPKRKRLGTLPPLHKPVVTFLGRITRQKGPQYFVEAAKLVRNKLNDVHFIMAGSGDMMPTTIELVAKLRLSSCFHFTGFLKGDQVDRVWKLTNIYVMPSVSEPFGISPLEAAQAGVPVIISNQSGVAEVMKHAIKVDFWNTHELANAIVKILKDQNLQKKLKTLAAKEIRSITWATAARKVKEVYQATLNV